MTTPGQKWRAARENAGLSAVEAGEAAGLHKNTIYNLERDDDGPTLRVMRQAADTYGITLGEIFCDDAELQPERVPAELRPLLVPLAPLTQQARESIVRNIAANLNFFNTLYRAGVNIESRKEVTADEPAMPPGPTDQPASTKELRGTAAQERAGRGQRKQKGSEETTRKGRRQA